MCNKQIFWIYCLLNIKICLTQIADLNIDLPVSTLDLVENDESVIPFQASQRENTNYENLKYQVPNDKNENSNAVNPTSLDENSTLQDDNDSDKNSTLNRINLGFLRGNERSFNHAGRSTRRIPTDNNSKYKNNNGFGPYQEYQSNPYLWSSSNEYTTKRYQENNWYTTKSTQQQYNQYTNQRPSWEQSVGSQQPQQSSFQSYKPTWEQSTNSGQQPNNKFQNQNQQSNWGSSSTQFGSSNNNWQNQNIQSVAFEDRPTWGSQQPTWSSNTNSNRQPSWQQQTTTTSTTRRPNSNSNWWSNSDDQAPVWTEKTTTTTGRYRPNPTKKPQRKSISEIKCEEYSKPYTQTINALPLSLDPEILTIKVGKCDRNAQALIVGGQRADLGEFPHMVAVGFRTGRGLSWNCGGSLISEKFVLTAAHCTDSSLGKPAAVRLGELNLVRNDDGASPENFKVVQVVAHPEYRSNKKYNDIALLKLDRAVTISNQVRPACLNTQNPVRSARVVATGWGSIGFGDRSSDTLLKVGLNIIDQKKCQNLYRSEQSSSLSNGIDGTQICAGDLQGGYDTCLGDSGGPLQITSETNKCIYKIIGITSFGKFCGEKNSPGVYTRVSSFIPWIESIVWP